MLKFFFNFWLYWVFIAAHGLSLVEASKGHSVAVCGLLTVGASLVSTQGCRVSVQASVVAACGLSSRDSWTLERRLSSCGTWV